MAPLRSVLYINDAAWVGGAEGALLDLAAGLDSREFRSCVVCPGEGEFADQLRASGVETRIVPFYGLRARNPLRYFETIIRLRALVRELGVGLVHVNHQYFSNYGVVLGRLSRLPVVVHLRGVETDEFFNAYGRRMVQADRVICISEAVRTRFLDYVTLRMPGAVAKRTEGRTRVVYDGLRVSAEPVTREALCREFGIDSGCRLVGIIGQVVPEKGIRDFIDAATIVLGECADVRFVVVGSDTLPGRDYAAEMAQYAATLGVGDRFTFTGFRSDAAGMHAALDVSVLASWQEGLGRVVLESLAAGTPVVATRVGGVPEVIEDGASGLLVSPHEPPSLAGAIIRVLRMPADERSRVVEGGRESLLRFSIEKHVEHVQNVYRELLG